MGAIKCLHAVAGSGIQAIVYEGAMRGVHIDELMTGHGLVVINKVHASAKTAARRGKTSQPRWCSLGTWEHDTATGPGTHQLAAVDGAASEIGLDDRADPRYALAGEADHKRADAVRIIAEGEPDFDLLYGLR